MESARLSLRRLDSFKFSGRLELRTSAKVGDNWGYKAEFSVILLFVTVREADPSSIKFKRTSGGTRVSCGPKYMCVRLSQILKGTAFHIASMHTHAYVQA